MVSTDIGVWVGALMTIGIYSLAFKYNKFYQFCEFTFMGLGIGYAAVVAYENVQKMAITRIMEGSSFYILSIILGLLIYTRYIPSIRYVSYYPLAIIGGVGIAVALRGVIFADIVKQAIASIKPIIGVGPLDAFNNIIFIIFLIAGLLVFVFTYNLDEIPGGNSVTRIGRIALMIGFGAQIGNTVATRYAFLIGRIQFLLVEWLGL